MVERDLAKVDTRVRFPSLAPFCKHWFDIAKRVKLFLFKEVYFAAR